MQSTELSRRDQLIFVTAIGGLGVGLVAYFSGATSLARLVWSLTIVLSLVPLSVDVFADLRRGKTGVDLIALLAMAAALAFGETLAGAVVAVMLSGGQLLESLADRRARGELEALLARVPHSVERWQEGRWSQVPIRSVAAGDRILVKEGAVVAVDGVLESAGAVIDQAALTGESLPVDYLPGQRLRSGTLNAGSAFEMMATATAESSTYAGIVRMVEEAAKHRAPLVRLADRYALGFLVFTLVLAAAAWFGSGNSTRLVAVLVVATPCPLILAAPIAVISGISRSAHVGVVIKGGAALETLARAQVVVVDKTGTVTTGTPEVQDVVRLGTYSEDEILRYAASLDLVSPHVLANAIVEGARRRGLSLTLPEGAVETPGFGVTGRVEEVSVRLGRSSWVLEGEPVPEPIAQLRATSRSDGSSLVLVAIEGATAGAIRLHDPVREDAPATFARLRALGLGPIVLATGDDRSLAERVGGNLEVDAVRSDLTPTDKVEIVAELRRQGTTVMVGDGLNDAPALALADVGVSMGARGATAASEAADVVILSDRFDRLADAVSIARRSRRIAVQSIWVGMTLSGLGMVAAAIGWLPPVAGALLQEAIDVAVIGNALRALRPG